MISKKKTVNAKGQTVYYIYHYDKNGNRVDTGKPKRHYTQYAISKSGKVNLEKTVKKLGATNDTKAIERIKAVIYTERAANPKKPLTVKTVKAKLARSTAERYIINSGLSPEQIAEELKTTVDALLNEANWDKDIYTDPNTGNVYRVSDKFTYDDNVESVFNLVVENVSAESLA